MCVCIKLTCISFPSQSVIIQDSFVSDCWTVIISVYENCVVVFIKKKLCAQLTQLHTLNVDRIRSQVVPWNKMWRVTESVWGAGASPVPTS